MLGGMEWISAGVRIFNVNDMFSGVAPDIGAYEQGEPLPHYGPRPRGVDKQSSQGAGQRTGN